MQSDLRLVVGYLVFLASYFLVLGGLYLNSPLIIIVCSAPLLLFLISWARSTLRGGSVPGVFSVLSFFLACYLIAVLVFAAAFSMTGVVSTSDPFADLKFVDLVYFAFVTITSLGYGDLQPSPSSRLVVILCVSVGMIMNGLFLSLLFLSFSSVGGSGLKERPKLRYKREIGGGDP